MSNIVKDISATNHAYYFFDDINNIENFDPNNSEINGKSQKTLLFTTLDMWRSEIWNEEINKNKYLMIAPTNESKEIIKKYAELWCKIRDLIRPITKNSDEYDENVSWKSNLIQMMG